MIRNHLRSNAIGCAIGLVALFVALGGNAAADHPGGADTISTEDIINGQVHTSDISNSNGVRSDDVRDDTSSTAASPRSTLAPTASVPRRSAPKR